MDAPEPSPHPNSAAELYAERAKRFSDDAARLQARSHLVSNLRGLAFAVMVIAALYAVFGSARLPAAITAAVSAVAFLVLVLLHSRVIEAEDDAKRWARVNRDGHARCTGKWRVLPEDGERFEKGDHPYADDLDVFGHGSLFQRLCVAHTLFGQDALHGFLSKAATPDQVRLRQEAARALAPELDTRQRLEALSLAVVERPEAPPGYGADQGDTPRPKLKRAQQELLRAAPDPEPLLRWAEGEPTLSKRLPLRIAAYVLPPLTLAGIVGAMSFDLPALVWTVPLLVQIVINMRTRTETGRVFTAVSATEGAFLRYGAMLEVFESLDVPSKLVKRLQEKARADGQLPSASMNDFRRKVSWFELRHNGLVHPFANTLFLWDLHCVLRLERWQARSGKVVRRWFSALGELEALNCIAQLTHDEPGFAFPVIDESAAVFEAKDLGHPLIDTSARVTNHVTLPAPGTAMLVTGSNMSGKSTLLRAMGLASVMALAGCPVCASQLRLSPMAVRTSIRISDSLESGVSHFYAELRKLKAVVDATAGALPVFFLLDEILHGTNSRERQIGARWILAELLRRGALGAVSTHDIELCRLPDELMQSVQLVHFRESVQNDQMSFDFKLREGPVTSGNALRLMRLIGLEVPLE